MSYEPGDRIRVIGPHTAQGSSFTRECQIGSLGTVIAVLSTSSEYGGLYRIQWDEGQKNTTTKGTSCIDGQCLTWESDAVLDQEVARLFGITHCSTCTCSDTSTDSITGDMEPPTAWLVEGDTTWIAESAEAAMRLCEEEIDDYFGKPIEWHRSGTNLQGWYFDGRHQNGRVFITAMEVRK